MNDYFPGFEPDAAEGTFLFYRKFIGSVKRIL